MLHNEERIEQHWEQAQAEFGQITKYRFEIVWNVNGIWPIQLMNIFIGAVKVRVICRVGPKCYRNYIHQWSFAACSTSHRWNLAKYFRCSSLRCSCGDNSKSPVAHISSLWLTIWCNCSRAESRASEFCPALRMQQIQPRSQRRHRESTGRHMISVAGHAAYGYHRIIRLLLNATLSLCKWRTLTSYIKHWTAVMHATIDACTEKNTSFNLTGFIPLGCRRKYSLWNQHKISIS